MIDVLDIAIADIAAQQISVQANRERKLREASMSYTFRQDDYNELAQSGQIIQPSVAPVSAIKRQQQVGSKLAHQFELISRLREMRVRVHDTAQKLLGFHQHNEHTDENDQCVHHLARLESSYSKLGDAIADEYGACDKLLAIKNAIGRLA